MNGITKKQVEVKKKPRKKRSPPISKMTRAKSKSRPKKQVEIVTMPTLEPDAPAEAKPLVGDADSMKPKSSVPKNTAKRVDDENVTCFFFLQASKS